MNVSCTPFTFVAMPMYVVVITLAFADVAAAANLMAGPSSAILFEVGEDAELPGFVAS